MLGLIRVYQSTIIIVWLIPQSIKYCVWQIPHGTIYSFHNGPVIAWLIVQWTSCCMTDCAMDHLLYDWFCNGPAIAWLILQWTSCCMTDSAMEQLSYDCLILQWNSYRMTVWFCTGPAIVWLSDSVLDQLLYDCLTVQWTSYYMTVWFCTGPAIVRLSDCAMDQLLYDCLILFCNGPAIVWLSDSAMDQLLLYWLPKRTNVCMNDSITDHAVTAWLIPCTMDYIIAWLSNKEAVTVCFMSRINDRNRFVD